MKSGLTIVEMAQQIERQSKLKQDYLLDTRRLQVEPFGSQLYLHTFDDHDDPLVEPLEINQIAHRQIGTHLKIPAAYYDRMLSDYPELLAENVNSWFQREPTQRMVRTLDGTVRAFLSNRYRRIDNLDMKKTSQQYLNSEAHGYLMEAKACKLLLKDLERIRAKLRRHIEKEAADRETEFEAAMQYHSESDIQEAYGWEFISEQQYDRYLELFRQGRKALDEHSPTVTELALSILNRIFQDIDRDCRQCEFEALSPEEQLAELKRAEESRQAWKQYIASLKEMVGSAAEQE